MISRIKRILERTDYFASHCYGRIKSCIPLSLFYAFDGMLNGAVKKGLSYWGLGKLPAVSTFLYYLYSFLNKAKETYEKHPDSSNLAIEQARLIATTEMIQGQLKKYAEDADSYLHQLKISDKHITELLDLEDKANPINIYPILLEIFQKIHPNQINYFHNLLDGLLHGITHLNEFLLLKYFADINLLSGEETFANNFLGFAVIFFGAISSIQTFSFNNQPKHPPSDKLLECIPHHFFKFREERLQQNDMGVSQYGSLGVSQFHLDRVKKFAADNAAQKCYLNCG